MHWVARPSCHAIVVNHQISKVKITNRGKKRKVFFSHAHLESISENGVACGRRVQGTTVRRDEQSMEAWHHRRQLSWPCRLKHRCVQWLGVCASYVSCRVPCGSIWQHEETLNSTAHARACTENRWGGPCNCTISLRLRVKSGQ